MFNVSSLFTSMVIVIIYYGDNIMLLLSRYLGVSFQMFDTWVMHEGWLWVGVADTVGLGLDIGICTSFIKLAIA